MFSMSKLFCIFDAFKNKVDTMERIIVAISGASGAIYGVRLLEQLASMPSVETHLILTKAGALNVASA